MAELQSLRIDRLLWHLRLVKSRSLAQKLVEAGHVRLNGQRIEKSSHEAKAGDVLTLPRGDGAIAVRLVAVPERRGPAVEARACYSEIVGDNEAPVLSAKTSEVSETGRLNMKM